MEKVGRQYNNDVPDWLKDKPAVFIKNCMDKIGLACTIKETDIVKKADCIFEVKSQSSNNADTIYKVNINQPDCQCHSWRWTIQPCKHMFAVLHHDSNTTWLNFPDNYRNSPFYTLDFDVATFLSTTTTLLDNDSDNTGTS